MEKAISMLIANPGAAGALAGVLVLLIWLISMRRIKIDARLIAQIGLVLAMATLLKVFRIYHLPQGGSITLGSMVPILLMALLHGPEIGCLTGFLYGIISFILSPYVLHPVQVLFDYPLPFMALGLAGFLREKWLVGVAIALFSRFFCHFISGVVFFASYAPKEMSPVIYSLMVNGIFMGIEGAICVVLIGALPMKRLKDILVKPEKGRFIRN